MTSLQVAEIGLSCSPSLFLGIREVCVYLRGHWHLSMRKIRGLMGIYLVQARGFELGTCSSLQQDMEGMTTRVAESSISAQMCQLW